MKHKLLLLSLLAFGAFLLNIFFYIYSINLQITNQNQQGVLGQRSLQPQIYIYGGDNNYVSGGVISQASTDEPAVYVSGDKLSGQVETTIYTANDDAVLD